MRFAVVPIVDRGTFFDEGDTIVRHRLAIRFARHAASDEGSRLQVEVDVIEGASLARDNADTACRGVLVVDHADRVRPIRREFEPIRTIGSCSREPPPVFEATAPTLGLNQDRGSRFFIDRKDTTRNRSRMKQARREHDVGAFRIKSRSFIKQTDFVVVVNSTPWIRSLGRKSKTAIPS